MAEIKHTTIDKLVPDDKNFNKGTEFGKGLLDKSFSKFGAGRSILIDKNNRIIAGNKATESFGESGGEKVIVVETTGDTLVAVKRTDIDLDSKEGRELALADNATQKADLAWDAGALDEVAGEWGIDPGDWGLETEDWETGAADGVKGEEDDFDEEKDFIAVRCKPGEVWELGDHRLMCGDSTNANDISKVMGKDIADMVFQSPPYNAGDSEKLSGNTHFIDSKYKNYDDNNNNYLDLILKSTNNAINVSKYTFINLQPLAGNKVEIVDFLWQTKNFLCDILIWRKTNTAPLLAQRVCNSAFEFVFVFSKQNNSRAIGTREFRGTVSNVFDCSPQRKNEYASEHAATFSVEFVGHYIDNFTNKGEIVADFFGGTGTTMIACEQLGRKCRMMEIDPHYCDIIIARWEKATGKTAKKTEQCLRK